jgi:two-component system LytT family sensor kinase
MPKTVSASEPGYRFLSTRRVYHSILWLTYIALMLFINYSSSGIWQLSIGNVLIHTFFLALLIYLNLYFLIPRFLSKNRIFLYFALLIFSAFILTPLELICLYWNLSGFEEARVYLLKNQFLQFLFMFFAALASSVFKIAKEWLLQERTKRALENKNLQSELSFLKSQINPHFLFNTLNSLYALTLKKSDKAPEIVLRLSDMMRYMLYESNEKLVDLTKEIDSIKNYLELEKIRYGEKAEIRFNCEGESIDKYCIPPLIFIPFLENAFKHGLSNSLGNGFVYVTISIKNKVLHFDIENSKTKEIHDERFYKGGIGLNNVKRRLELIFGQNYKLKISDSENSYKVALELNLQEKK